MIKKFILWSIIGLVLVAALVIWRLVANLDTIVANMIEESGSKALNTEVSVRGVTLALSDGSATIEGLRVANPEGWSDAAAFNLDRIAVGLDIASLNKPVLVIDDIDIGSSAVSYEIKADGSNNMQSLLSGMESSSADTTQNQGQEILMSINRLSFAGMDVSVLAEAPPGEEETGLQQSEFGLPGLEMSGIGGAAGAPPQVVAGVVGRQLVNEIIAAAARAGVNKLVEKEKEKLTEKLLEKLRDD